ncbi:MAG: hypothetical protein FJX45_17845 [Alphaproteobacteria bacterium]|nr:hypothetical protein [Alphaproteobacteria bacterium]MBM3653604.1 hypothetical protein [Alphaproteobacteria bacterium]
MAALARTPRSTNLRRIGALWIALFFAATSIFSAAPARAAQTPRQTAAHCLEKSIPSPTKHPCGGDACCPLCGHSQKELVFSFILSASNVIVYTPPRAARFAFRAFRSPSIESVPERAWAPPRAPPRFS